MDPSGRVIVHPKQFDLIVDRLCQQLIEEYGSFEDTCMVGIQPRGSLLGQQIVLKLLQILPEAEIPFGKLDITFYRDDFRKRAEPLRPNTNQMNFLIEQKRVILVDDVLYTGRTVQSALTALNHYGRPNQVELLVLVDRRFNRHLPIQADFVGYTVDAIDQAYVKVDWAEKPGNHQIILFSEER